jgi:hypothetical protein
MPLMIFIFLTQVIANSKLTFVALNSFDPVKSLRAGEDSGNPKYICRVLTEGYFYRIGSFTTNECVYFDGRIRIKSDGFFVATLE